MPKIKIKKTERGFAIGEFTDDHDVPCTIQKSSLATEDAIWLGCAELGVKVFDAGKGWVDYEFPDPSTKYIGNNRMHLTRKQVRDLLPLLNKFVETGELI